MQRTVRTAILAGAFAVGAIAPATAAADEFDCVGVAPASVDNLRVPEGASCTADGTRVKGTVKVERDATFTGTGIGVIGNVQGENARRVIVTGSRVGGSLQVKQGGGAELRTTTINGDIQLDANAGAAQVVDRNDVGGSIQVVSNQGGVTITANLIDGNLQCKENSPPPTGGANVVQGNAEDQCAGLAGGEPVQQGAVTVTASTVRGTGRVASVALRCEGAHRCSGTLKLTRGGRSLGQARFSLGLGAGEAVAVRLNRRGDALRRRAGRVRVVAIAVTAAGTTRSSARL